MQPTPLLRSELLSRALDADIWLKCETATPIASFKIRGALNAAYHARQTGVRGVVTSSTGNHGQGVAYAARLLGMKADIFLPDPANPVKAQMIQAFGATLHVIGDDFDIAKTSAIQFAQCHDLAFINDGEDIDMMEGAGTIGLEICQQLEDIDLVLIPLGGGNLAGGCATAIKSLSPDTRVTTVQASGSPAVTESYHCGHAVERPIDTLADGLVTRIPPALALDVMLEVIDDAWLATDQALLGATRDLVEMAHIMVEPAGAAALAGACTHRDFIKGKKAVFILTGANISLALLGQALDQPSLLGPAEDSG
jgi:threonine dehydratase